MRRNSFIAFHHIVRDWNGHRSGCIGSRSLPFATRHTFIASVFHFFFSISAFSDRCFLNFPLCLHFTCSPSIYTFEKLHLPRPDCCRLVKWIARIVPQFSHFISCILVFAECIFNSRFVSNIFSTSSVCGNKNKKNWNESVKRAWQVAYMKSIANKKLEQHTYVFIIKYRTGAGLFFWSAF